ncbi:hypothetical protein [Ewingella americana]
MNITSKTLSDNKLHLMASEKVRAKEAFSQAFSGAGFTFHQPDGLIPSHDKSTLFTGSTISTFKPYLQQNAGLVLNPMFTVQDCLRTQNNLAMQDVVNYPKWSSLFSSVGAIGRYQDRYLIVQALRDFISNLELNTPARLRINIASRDHDIIDMLEAEGMADYLHFDSQQPAYYCHKFGMDGITGRNCNLAVSSDGETFMDIGNLIVIESAQAPLGVEAAFGLETIVTRMHGLCSSILALSAATCFSIHSAENLYIIDALVACVAIMSFDIQPIANNRGRVLRRYLQGLNQLRLKNSISIEFIADAARHFELTHYKTQHIYKRIEQYLQQHTLLVVQDLTLSNINMRLSHSLCK